MAASTWQVELRPEGEPPFVGEAFVGEAGSAAFSSRVQAESLRDPLIPILEKIIPGEQFVSGHFLEKYIRHDGPLSRNMVDEILSDPRINLSVLGYDSGTIPAAQNKSSSYFYHAWTRDSALIACALSWSGHHEIAEKVISNLSMFYGTKEQRDRICSFLWSEDAPERFRACDYIPFIRAKIDDESGKMVRFIKRSDGIFEDAENWAHAQLDAIGLWLWTTFRFANSSTSIQRPSLDLNKIENSLSELNSDNSIESLFVVAIKFLEKIRFWDQHDFGPWEETSCRQRASSIAMCVAALQEANKFFTIHGWDALTLNPTSSDPENVTPSIEHACENFKQTLNHALCQGEEALKIRIPDAEGKMAVECDEHPADAALILTLYPITAGMTKEQEMNVLRTVYRLMGEAGFKRYEGDPYVGEDYIYAQCDYLMADTAKPCYREAEWVLFDFTLSAYYFRRFEESQGRDLDAYLYGHAHYKRGLAYISSDSDQYFVERTGQLIQVESGSLGEAHFWDSHQGQWRSNCNSPLNWTKAACSLASERLKASVRLYEAITHS